MSLWIDVTGLVRGSGHFSGVPRVRTTLILKWLSVSEIDIRYFEYDGNAAAFREIPDTFLRPFLEKLGTGSAQGHCVPPITRLSRLNRIVEKGFQGAFFFLHREARCAADEVYQAGLRFAKTLVAPLRRAVRRQREPAPFPLAKFGAQDVLLLLDWVWVDGGYGPALAKVQRETGARLSPLIYDLLPWRFPHFFSIGFAKRFCDALTDLLAHTAVAITVSEHARGEIVQFCRERRQAAPAVEVMALGCEFQSHGTERAVVNGPYALAVGAVGVRKNYGLLYQVWRSLIEQYGEAVPKLVIVGGNGFLTGDLLYQLRHDPLVQEKIVVLDGIDDPVLSALYANCLFTLYPSFYEGSGVPVLESLAAGKYCVASSASSVPEMGGRFAGYHEPNDFVSCRKLIEQAWRNPAFRAEREAAIRREFRATTWAEAADIYLSLLRRHFAAQPAAA